MNYFGTYFKSKLIGFYATLYLDYIWIMIICWPLSDFSGLFLGKQIRTVAYKRRKEVVINKENGDCMSGKFKEFLSKTRCKY